ncbi:hypothetical protein MNBD_ALPHA05-405 [hydrothermal vent metagenome]|uniref:Membrane fusion protein (MFP) family protein n=1 Tax=hydrothermal vent metagenome TaxID=652676 RepID=A0A3B0TII5_9ZZZZ
MNTDQKLPAHQPLSVGERHGISLPLELEEGAPPVLMRSAMAIISGLVLMLLVWANIAQIRELSVATGEISPYGSTREVAHLEGGIVDEVLIKPGDNVQAGDAIVQLRVENAGGEYDRIESRRANLLMEAERLAAQIEGRSPEFTTDAGKWSSLATEQLAIFNSSVNQHTAMMATLAAKQSSAQSDIIGARADHKAKNQLVSYAREQLQIQEELIEEGFTSKQAYLEAKAAYAGAQAAAAASKARFEQTKRALESATSELENADATYKNRAAEQRADAIAELAELARPLQSLEDRAQRLTVRAPVSGIVKSVAVDGAGDVVRPGGLVAEITPASNTLFAEVRVNPKDIGHVIIGQETDVSVTAFDPNRYGKIKGRIMHISADTFTNERTRETYYIAYVALDDDSGSSDRLIEMLTPGMQVRAEIITESRSLMQYMLKPVLRPLNRAFSER